MTASTRAGSTAIRRARAGPTTTARSSAVDIGGTTSCQSCNAGTRLGSRAAEAKKSARMPATKTVPSPAAASSATNSARTSSSPVRVYSSSNWSMITARGSGTSCSAACRAPTGSAPGVMMQTCQATPAPSRSAPSATAG